MKANKQLQNWLYLTCGFILAMVFIGGVTRLTGSGLSITEWKPIMGAIPPLTEAAWQEAFLKYQQIPQFKLLNSQMILSEFKFIFFWEYFHRLVGRLVGIVFALPLAWFWIRGQLTSGLKKKLLIALALGGLQGLMGWVMVMSGLSERVYVSHYRLAIHLVLALILFAYLLWTAFELNPAELSKTNSDVKLKDSHNQFNLRAHLAIVTMLLVLQIIYGAFTAGLKAGYGYNTFPKMQNEWLASDGLRMMPMWINFLENPAGVQFAHRTLAWLLFFSIAVFWLKARKIDGLKNATGLLATVVSVQFLLGVSTLVLVIPIWLASLHQIGACILLAVLVYNHYVLKREFNSAK